MIRKPDASDFRESSTVTTLRDAHAVAVEGARGIGEGTAKFFGRAVMLLFGFGFVMSVVGHAGPAGLLFVFAAIVVFFALRRSKREKRDRMRWDPLTAHPDADAADIVPARYELSPGAAGRAAAKAAVPAILFFPTSAIGYMLPFAIGGILYVSVAMLILARLAGDRTVLRYDKDSVTVSGLLGENTLLWDDVADIEIRKFSFGNFRVLFTSGATRNLVIHGHRNRFGGARSLHIPVDLLALDQGAIAALASRFLRLQACGHAVIPVAAHRVRHPDRGEVSSAFDPDEIMSRYLAERAALAVSQRPDLAASRPVFGRKRT